MDYEDKACKGCVFLHTFIFMFFYLIYFYILTSRIPLFHYGINKWSGKHRSPYVQLIPAASPPAAQSCRLFRWLQELYRALHYISLRKTPESHMTVGQGPAACERGQGPVQLLGKALADHARDESLCGRKGVCTGASAR